MSEKDVRQSFVSGRIGLIRDSKQIGAELPVRARRGVSAEVKKGEEDEPPPSSRARSSGNDWNTRVMCWG